MVDVYSDTTIRFASGHRDEDEQVTIGIERSYVPSGYGRDQQNKKTGPWGVTFRSGSFLSSCTLPADVVPDVIAALEKHAAECVRRNSPPAPPEETPESIAAEEFAQKMATRI